MGFDLGSIWASIGVNTAALDKGLMSAELKLASADKTITGYGQKLTANSTKMMMAGGLMVGAVAGVAIAAVKMASDFETSMRNVNSISKLSEDKFKALGESVIGISKKFPQTAKELADGLYDIASSGFQGAAGLKVLEASASAASAGLTNTATSAKGITAVLNAYGLEAEDAAGVSDTMFRTVDKGVITFEELSGQIGEVVGTAKIAGIGFNELSGMIAYMTTKGINAAEATTALNRMMLSIITPTEELAAVLKNAGFESGQMALEQIGLTGVMKLIEEAAHGDVAAINAMSGDMRAFKAVASLTGSGIEELNNFMGDFKDTTGATSIALKEQSKSLEFQLKLLKNGATAIGIEIGNKLLPSITKYVTAADGMTAANTELIASNIILAGKIGGAVAGVLLLSAAYGKVLAIVGQLAGAGATVAGGAVAVAGGVGLFNMAQKLNELSTVIHNTYRSANDFLITLQAIAKLGLPTQLVDFFVDWLNKIFGIDKAIGNVIPTTAGWGAAMAKTNENLTANNSATVEAIVIQKDNETTLKNLQQQYGFTAEQALVYAEANGLLKIATEASTGANEAETKSIDDMRGAYNALIATLFDGINANNTLQEAQWAVDDATKAVTEAIKQYGAGSREAEQAQNNLDTANQKVVDSFYGVYTSVKATKEEQEAARIKAIEYGTQLVQSGKWGEEEFISMASQFGFSSGQIIAMANNIESNLDDATKPRTVKVDVDYTAVAIAVGNIAALIGGIGNKTVYVDTWHRDVYGKAMGGIVGHAMGGIIGIPQASTGMVVPQTGRAIPILAHEYEDIVNTSQQRNLAEWIMGKANSRPDSKSSSSNEVILHNVINLDGKVLWESNEKYDIRAAGVRV